MPVSQSWGYAMNVTDREVLISQIGPNIEEAFTFEISLMHPSIIAVRTSVIVHCVANIDSFSHV